VPVRRMLNTRRSFLSLVSTLPSSHRLLPLLADPPIGPCVSRRPFFPPSLPLSTARSPPPPWQTPPRAREVPQNKFAPAVALALSLPESSGSTEVTDVRRRDSTYIVTTRVHTTREACPSCYSRPCWTRLAARLCTRVQLCAAVVACLCSYICRRGPTSIV